MYSLPQPKGATETTTKCNQSEKTWKTEPQAHKGAVWIGLFEFIYAFLDNLEELTKTAYDVFISSFKLIFVSCPQ